MSVRDIEMKAGIFLGKVIIVEHGKQCAPSLALDWQTKRLIEVGPEFLFTPGGGMCMLPRLCLWLTIIGRCWPGIL